jgi:hypothetical protein
VPILKPASTLTFDVSTRFPLHSQNGNVGINRRGTLTTSVRPGEEMVLPAKSHCAQRPFHCVVVDLDATVVALEHFTECMDAFSRDAVSPQKNWQR